MFSTTLPTPIGQLTIEATETDVCFIGFRDELPEKITNAITDQAAKQILEYFQGERHAFDFPIAQTGTDFQQKVWAKLLEIPAGKPISYAALSKMMDNPLAIRAIAAANGKNNLMIVVPCHRVIGSNGDLVGYAGGLWRKKWLLEHEAKMLGIGQAVLAF